MKEQFVKWLNRILIFDVFLVIAGFLWFAMVVVEDIHTFLGEDGIVIADAGLQVLTKLDDQVLIAEFLKLLSH